MKVPTMLVASVVLVACSTSPEPTSTGLASKSSPRTTTVGGVGDAGTPAASPGFRLQVTRSRFALGPIIGVERWGKYERNRGANGVIATTDSGATISVLNYDANEILLARGPLSRDPAVHAKAVEDYFFAAGLPPTEVGGVSTLTLMNNSGSTITDRTDKPRTLLAYTSVLERRVAGYKIAGSYAWASFNVDGDVVAEEVYWPPVPANALATAQSLTQQLNSSTIATLKAHLSSPKYKGGDVVVHHSAQFSDAFKYFVSVDFYGEGLPERHLQLNGSDADFSMGAGP